MKPSINQAGPHKFPPLNRLVKRYQYLNLGKKGQKLYTPGFIGVCLPNNSLYARLGITVTKKIGHAAQRNHIKRVVREYFRCHKEDIKGWDLNIIARKDAVKLSTIEKFTCLEKFFKKIKD